MQDKVSGSAEEKEKAAKKFAEISSGKSGMGVAKQVFYPVVTRE